MASLKLIEATKEAMEYTDKPDNCANCAHSQYDYDPITGNQLYCNYSNLCSFSISETGYCAKFKQKGK